MIFVIAEFENALSDDELKSTRYAYRVLYAPISVNRKGQADSVIEFVKPGSAPADDIEWVLIKETEKAKFLPGEIVEISMCVLICGSIMCDTLRSFKTSPVKP
jgi:hypothetical protein